MTPKAPRARILMLGGAGETAAALAAVRGRAGLEVRVLCDGATPKGVVSDLQDVTQDRAGLTQALRAGGFTHLLDVTHGFAGQISTDAAAACKATGAQYALLHRPAWTPATGDRWTEVPDVAAASDSIAPFERVFTNVGRALLPALAGFGGQLFVRQTTRHTMPPPQGNIRYVFGSPPFSHDAEVALLRDLVVDAVLFRNTGGTASETKLTAARALGLQMVMLSRPVAPEGTHLPDVAAVARWADSL